MCEIYGVLSVQAKTWAGLFSLLYETSRFHFIYVYGRRGTGLFTFGQSLGGTRVGHYRSDLIWN